MFLFDDFGEQSREVLSDGVHQPPLDTVVTLVAESGELGLQWSPYLLHDGAKVGVRSGVPQLVQHAPCVAGANPEQVREALESRGAEPSAADEAIYCRAVAGELHFGCPFPLGAR